MKWIGQHIWDLTSRFRNDVYITDGKLGIGTTAPDHKFHVEFTNGDTSFSGGGLGNWGSDGIRIENTSGTVDTMAMLQFRNADADIHIAGIRQGTNDSDLGFFFEGSEKMRIDSSGKVGIGTTSPNKNLTVEWLSNNTVVDSGEGLGGGTAGSGVLIQNGSYVANTYANLDFRAGTADGRIAYKYNGLNDGDFHFITDDGNNPETKLFIKNNGNVGIGTTSPAYKLDVRNSSTLFYGQTDLTDSTSIFRIRANGGSSEVLEIEANGNIGIGTANPTEKLHVIGDARIQGNLTVNGTYTQIDTDVNTTEQWLVTNDGTGPAAVINQLGSQDIFDVQDDGTSVFYIEDGGNIGIGTTTPNEKLEVDGNIRLANSGKLYLWQTHDANYLQYYRWELNSSLTAYINNAGSGGVALKTAGNTRLFVDSSGNVGIGTTSPQSPLHVHSGDGGTYSPNSSHDDLTIEGSGNIGLQLFSPNSTYQYIAFGDPESANAGYVRYHHGSNTMVLRTNNQDRVNIDSSGNVGIGTTSPSYKLDVAGAINIQDGYTLRYNNSSNISILGSSSTGLTYTGIEHHFKAYDGSSTYSEYMTIDTGGNVGIGTTSPHNKAHITSSGNQDGLLLDLNTGASGDYTGVYFKVDNNTTNAYKKGGLVWERTGSYNEGRFHFLLNNEDNTNNVDLTDSKLTILSTGNVGIGTTSPSFKLDVKTSSSDDGISLSATSGRKAIEMLVDNGTNGGGDIKMYTGTSVLTNRINAQGSSYINGGNVGIGTTSPSYDLEVNGDVRATSEVFWGNNNNSPVGRLYSGGQTGVLLNTSNDGIIQLSGGDQTSSGGNVGLYGGSHSSFANEVRFRSGSTHTMTIDSSGNVGIGTTSPSYALDVKKDDASILHLYRPNSSTAASTNLDFSFNTADASQALYARITADVETNTNSAQGGDLSFHTANAGTISEVMRLTEDGNVGIGTTSPGKLLDVNGTFRSVGEAFFLGTIDVTAGTNSRFRDGVALNFNTNRTARIFTDSNDLIIQQGEDNKHIIFRSDDGSGGVTPYLTIDGSAEQTRFYKNTRHTDGIKAYFGNADDLELSHDGNNSWITNATGDLKIYNNADNGDIVFASDDGSGGVTEYFRVDGGVGYMVASKAIRALDSVNLQLGTSADFTMQHNGVNTILQNFNGNLEITQGADDGDIVFKSDDGSGGVETYFYLDGSHSSGNPYTHFPDNSHLVFGTSTDDLDLYHNGTNSYIQNTTGNLIINQRANDGDLILQCDDGSGGETPYLTLDGSSGYTKAHKHILYEDNAKAMFGTGGDMQILHDGSNSYISHNVTGDLYIQNNANDRDIVFQSDDGSGGTTAYLTIDGGLGFTTLQKNLRANDDVRILVGSGQDAEFFHDGANTSIRNTTGDLQIRQAATDKDIIFKCDDGSGGETAYLTLDGSATRTNVHKDLRFDDNIGAVFGSGAALKLHSDGSNGLMDNYQGSLIIRQQVDDADISFQCDDGSGGVTEYFRLDGGEGNIKFYKDISNQANANLVMGGGQIKFSDAGRFYAGDSNDLQIYHDGSNSYIVDAGTGDLLNYFSNEWKVIKYGSSETCIEATSDGSVDLYYDNSKKFETTSTGVEVTGNISLTGSVQKQIQVFPMNFVDDLGTDKHFMPFVTNTEQTVNYQEEAAMVMPADGRVVSVTVHYAQMHGSDGNITVGIETSACGQSYTNAWTVEETETIAASVADDHHVFHFAFDNAKHFESTDKMAISIQQSTDMQSASRFFWVTAVIEYDWSTFLGGTSAEHTTTP